MTQPPLVCVRNYVQHFRMSRSLTIQAVNGISLNLYRGEIFGLVGESGSGKSTLARAIMGIYTPTAGEVYFKEQRVSDARSSAKSRADIQRNMQCIFQDSAAALNPHMTVFDIVAEPLRLNGLYAGPGELQARVHELMDSVGLDRAYASKTPGEISGGQRQRAAIARSIGPDPDLIVGDEPIASLDVSIQAQIVNLFQTLQRQKGFTFLFISHDLSMVRYLCTRVGVMYRGKIVELAPTEELFAHPLHPYTQTLLCAIPLPDPRRERTRSVTPYDGRIDPAADLREVSAGHWVL